MPCTSSSFLRPRFLVTSRHFGSTQSFRKRLQKKRRSHKIIIQNFTKLSKKLTTHRYLSCHEIFSKRISNLKFPFLRSFITQKIGNFPFLIFLKNRKFTSIFAEKFPDSNRLSPNVLLRPISTMKATFEASVETDFVEFQSLLLLKNEKT